MRGIIVVRDIYGVRNLGILSIILTHDNDVKKIRMGEENRGISLKSPQISHPRNMSYKVISNPID